MNEVRVLTGAFLGVAVLAVAGSVIPGVDEFLDWWVWRLGVAGIVGVGVWFGVQELRARLFWREMRSPVPNPIRIPLTEDVPSLEEDVEPVDLDAVDDEEPAELEDAD